MLPGLAFASPATLDSTQRALQAAQQQAAAHHAAAAQAKLKAARDAAQAAALAQQQVAAAAAARHLEDQTAAAAATLADLGNQSKDAKQALQQNEAALASLLPIMQRLSSDPAATMLAVPASPTDAIRGILVLQGIAAEIERRAKAVSTQAQLVASLQTQTLAQQAVLTQAVASQQKAEDALSAQISAAHTAETTDLDTAAQAAAAEVAAAQNVHDLRNMIDRLQAKERSQEAAARAVPSRREASVNLSPGTGVNVSPGTGTSLSPGTGANVLTGTSAPVAGTIIQAFGAPTVAGPAVGLLYRAAPGARVAAPCAGPILYANSFQSYGLLVIIDCGNNYDFVLSGMRHLDVTAGQNIARGQPVGEMLGYSAANPAQQPLLYVELRRNGTPVNPAVW